MDLATWARQIALAADKAEDASEPKRHLCDLLSLVQVFLNLVLEFVPETVYRISKHYSKNSQRMPTLFVKLYVYQVGACNSLGCWCCCVRLEQGLCLSCLWSCGR